MILGEVLHRTAVNLILQLMATGILYDLPSLACIRPNCVQILRITGLRNEEVFRFDTTIGHSLRSKRKNGHTYTNNANSRAHSYAYTQGSDCLLCEESEEHPHRRLQNIPSSPVASSLSRPHQSGLLPFCPYHSGPHLLQPLRPSQRRRLRSKLCSWLL
jgi:hypothetical protein